MIARRQKSAASRDTFILESDSRDTIARSFPAAIATNARVCAMAIFAAPVRRIAHPRLAAEDRGHVGQIKPHGRIGRGTVEPAVMLDAGRDDQNVSRVHVVRPVRDAVFGGEQHPDDELRIGRRPLRPEFQRKMTRR